MTPLRLIPYVTYPSISHQILLEHLHNPIGDYFPQLESYRTDNPSVKIDCKDWRQNPSQFPAGGFILRTDFEEYQQFKVGYEKPELYLSHVIPDDELKIALEGFEHLMQADELAEAGSATVRETVVAKEYYTQAEAASKLRMTPNYVFDQMMDPDPFPSLDACYLRPSVYLSEPVKMQEVISDGKSVQLTGLFDIFTFDLRNEYKNNGYLCLSDNRGGFQFEDIDAITRIIEHFIMYPDLEQRNIENREHNRRGNSYAKSLGVEQFVILYKDGIKYMLDEPKSVHVSELLISSKTLEAYAKYRGIALVSDKPTIEPSEQEPELTATAAVGQDAEQHTPQELVAKLRKDKEPEFIIAAILNREFPEKSAFDKMKLIDPARVKQWEESPCQQGRPKEWFNYRVKEGNKILANRKNMTVS